MTRAPLCLTAPDSGCPAAPQHRRSCRMGAATCVRGQSPVASSQHSEEEEGRSPARTALSRVQCRPSWCSQRVGHQASAAWGVKAQLCCETTSAGPCYIVVGTSGATNFKTKS